MKCEEFEAIGLDSGRDSTLNELERIAVREHAATCQRCAALQDSWQVASDALRAFANATRIGQITPRAELRLRQEFRSKHRTLKMRRAAVVTAWALAAAAVLVGAVSWKNWRAEHLVIGAKNPVSAQNVGSAARKTENAATNGAAPEQQTNTAKPQNARKNDATKTLVAENDLKGFTLLPGSVLPETDEADIVRVRMQRGALGALGLEVNEDRAADWILVDLLVGNDGLPQAVRLPQE